MDINWFLQYNLQEGKIESIEVLGKFIPQSKRDLGLIEHFTPGTVIELVAVDGRVCRIKVTRIFGDRFTFETAPPRGDD